jgi:hypothetical protein
MFQFRRFALSKEYHAFSMMGCPIRIPADQPLPAGPHSVSSLATSFVATRSRGIPQTPLLVCLLYLVLIDLLINPCAFPVGQRTQVPAPTGQHGSDKSISSNKHTKPLPLSASAGQFQKGDVPAAPSGTATLLRLSPSHQIYPHNLHKGRFRSPRLPWLDGRCVQGPGTYSPRHG